MELAFVVYLVGIIPTIKGLFGFISILGTLIVSFAAVVFFFASKEQGGYSWENLEQKKKDREGYAVISKRCLKAAILTVSIGVVSCFIPSKDTLYAILAAYGVQTIVENETAKELASDGVDVLKALMQKAKADLVTEAVEK